MYSHSCDFELEVTAVLVIAKTQADSIKIKTKPANAILSVEAKGKLS